MSGTSTSPTDHADTNPLSGHFAEQISGGTSGPTSIEAEDRNTLIRLVYEELKAINEVKTTPSAVKLIDPEKEFTCSRGLWTKLWVKIQELSATMHKVQQPEILPEDEGSNLMTADADSVTDHTVQETLIREVYKNVNALETLRTIPLCGVSPDLTKAVLLPRDKWTSFMETTAKLYQTLPVEPGSGLGSGMTLSPNEGRRRQN
ncbi:hypothetical protein TREMEDRAFT_59632 [Tremella mesenterica DSM 1558]|uniref:uncharacterized protein n=1 Tax=Tremella mesenterica (strain ATCC 24925 / CBS 8224 / DSM 1558 / NBRC 9311 / NRRL Y-6157 / RJB 2259-6 / UBC 559-6) TaxID=578456 RepID=UPI0003F49E18|nr:uncharacterized protein TREMEDRAFT_59632 [Tremella mesenterica DSM 1558]EIW73464.1 hypothetical protein TREMEDRAFT_59632 [Tremella mesenterica DSM 1558]